MARSPSLASSEGGGDHRTPTETQFIPQSGDEDVLWEVIEVTAERKGMYKVRWQGLDPATNKPWAQSWVPKKDVTPDLSAEWKAKSAATKRRVKGKKGNSRLSINTTKSSPPQPTPASPSSTSSRSTALMSSNALLRKIVKQETAGKRKYEDVNSNLLLSKPFPRKKRKISKEFINISSGSESSAISHSDDEVTVSKEPRRQVSSITTITRMASRESDGNHSRKRKGKEKKSTPSSGISQKNLLTTERNCRTDVELPSPESRHLQELAQIAPESRSSKKKHSIQAGNISADDEDHQPDSLNETVSTFNGNFNCGTETEEDSYSVPETQKTATSSQSIPFAGRSPDSEESSIDSSPTRKNIPDQTSLENGITDPVRREESSLKPLMPIKQISPSAFFPVMNSATFDDIESFSSPVKPSSNSFKQISDTSAVQNQSSSDEENVALKVRGKQFTPEHKRRSSSCPPTENLSKTHLDDNLNREKISSDHPFLDDHVSAPLNSELGLHGDLDSQVQAIEHDLIDYEGGVGIATQTSAPTLDKKEPISVFPEEEEEDTQDIIHQRMAFLAPNDQQTSQPKRHSDPLHSENSTIALQMNGTHKGYTAPAIAQPSVAFQDISNEVSFLQSKTVDLPTSLFYEEGNPKQSEPSLHFGMNQAPLQSDDKMNDIINAKSEEIEMLKALLQKRDDEILRLEVDLEAELHRQSERQQAWDAELVILQGRCTSAESSRENIQLAYFKQNEYFDNSRRELADAKLARDIAESQVSQGLEQLRAWQLQQGMTLKKDVAKWKQLAELTSKRESQMNDDIRRLAAEAPQLENRLNQMQKNLQQSETRLGKAHRNVYRLETQIATLCALGRTLKETDFRDRDKIEALIYTLDEADMMYRCSWLVAVGSTSRHPCNEEFDSLQALYQHMYGTRHLQGPTIDL